MAAPPDCGRRLIPQILDSLAATAPDRAVYSIAKSSDISQGFRELSARAFAKAVDKTAWWLENHVGRSTSFEALAYIGPHDVRQILLTYAAVKAGYKPVFLSPKNSIDGAIAVLEATECRIWVQPSEQPRLSLVQDFLEKRPMKVLELPEADYLLDAETTEYYPYEKTFEEAADEVFCVLHTSGSTGLPKPVIWTHALLATMDAVRLLPPSKDGMLPWTADWNECDRIWSAFPMSHGAGILMDIIIPSLFGMHCIMGPVGVVPNLSLIDSLAEHGQIDVWSIVPSLVDELGESPDVLAKFSSSKFICASGGPISHISASKVNKTVRVLNLTGTTEGLFIGNLVVDREDFFYFAFHEYSGFEFREVEPGVYEHWIIRNEHCPHFQGLFVTFPELQEYNFKDLYVKHPTKADHWAYKGRSDDVVVLSNGYKISPLDMEAFITLHPAVNGCLVVGTGKHQAAILVELKDPSPSARNAELHDSIWATAEKANAMAMHKGQLRKDFIIFADAEKAFSRTDKGTIKRRATLELYEADIDRFYDSLEANFDPEQVSKADTESIESITRAVRHALESFSPDFENITPDSNVFDFGLDSLGVVRVTRSLQAATGLRQTLGPRHVYANPTLATFAAAILELASRKGAAEDKAKLEVKEKLSRMDPQLATKMDGLDLQVPTFYSTQLVYIPLRKGVGFEAAFDVFQRGLARLLELMPALNGKLVPCSEDEPGYKKGQVRIVQPDPPSASANGPRQLAFKDLSQTLPSYEELRKARFPPGVCTSELVLDVPWIPSLPTDVMAAQANFIDGGCVLATAFLHTCVDGTGFVNAITAWAESCRFAQGDAKATCNWLDPESMNRNLLHVLWEREGYAKPAESIDPATWRLLARTAPEGEGTESKNTASKESKNEPIPSEALQAAAPVSKPSNQLEFKMFYIPPENMATMQQEVAADPAAKGVVKSASDMVYAWFWRGIVRARYQYANEMEGRVFESDDNSVLNFIVDARPYFSPLLPASYMGNLVVFHPHTLPLKTLCAPDTTIGYAARVIRDGTTGLKPSTMHDAYTLLQTVPQDDYSQRDFKKYRCKICKRGNTPARGDELDVVVSNMMLLQTDDISFGGGVFDNGGAIGALRLGMSGYNAGGRISVILPMDEHGGVEVYFNAYPEEFELLLKDGEFARFGSFRG